MKKLYIIIIFLCSLFSKSYAQFPFYGLELSNYEVGDSLEYNRNSWATNSHCLSDELYCIIGKKYLGLNDSVEYKIRILSNGYCDNNGTYHYSYGVDTITRIISNDTVYNNHNNILGIYLDTLPHPDSPGGPNDSAYIHFDTINSHKHLNYKLLVFAGYIHTYEAEEDIGLENWSTGYENQLATNTDGHLEFYHLVHAGIAGRYYKLFDNIPKPLSSAVNTYIYYDNFFTAFMRVPAGNSSSRLFIYDLQGKEEKQIALFPGSNLIDMTNLPRGIYFYRTESGGEFLSYGKLLNL